MEYFLTSDKTKIYYNIQGSGKPIIFIHGFAAKSNVFRVPQKVLSKEYLTLSYDQRGHGMSRDIVEGISMDILARDLYELIAYLQLKDVTLIGWSMGGAVIFEYISKYGYKNIDKIVIVDTGPKVVNDKDWNLGLYNGDYKEAQGRTDLKKMSDWDEFSKVFMTNMAPFLDQRQLDLAIASMRDNNQKHMISIWKDLISKDYRNVLRDIDIPTLVIIGGKSSLYSKETGDYIRENIKGSNLLIFEEDGHLLVQENPTGFSKALKEFIL